jgi:hypothetical protein
MYLKSCNGKNLQEYLETDDQSFLMSKGIPLTLPVLPWLSWMGRRHTLTRERVKVWINTIG